MGVHMEEEAVHAHSEIAVEESLDICRSLVPDSSHLCESLCLYDAFAIDMASRYGIEHIVRLVVCGRVKPVLAHRKVCIAVMVYAVGHHCRRYALA